MTVEVVDLLRGITGFHGITGFLVGNPVNY
jgi:hypothetical protein